MKKVLDLLKELAMKDICEEDVCILEGHSKEALDLNVLVNNSLVF